jgi:hypothetical protein
MREGMVSIVAGAIFAVAITGSAGFLGVSILFSQKQTTVAEKAFGVFMLFVAAFFVFLCWLSLRRGRWMVVYDRGEPGTPGEIRYNGKRLPVDRVRGFSTRNVGGKMPRSSVVAELHDGTLLSLLSPLGFQPIFQQWQANT